MKMKVLLTFIITTIGLLLGTVAHAEKRDVPAFSELNKTLPNTLAKLYERYELKGDLLLAVVDKTGMRYTYTLNTLGEDPGENGLGTATPFLIASHTKAFTGTLAQVLANEGLLELNAPIAKYLSNDLKHTDIDSSNITVKQLLNHTAGFTSVMHTFKSAFLGFKDEEELIRALSTNTLIAPPGVFRYSNTGPILAARAMEKATGKNWKSLMKDKLFTPLGMQHTSSELVNYPPDAILPSIEVGQNNEVIRKGIFKTDSTLHAAGGHISTLEDMAKWLAFNLNKNSTFSSSASFFEPLHNTTVKQEKRYFTYNRTGYSLAWDIAEYHDKPILTRFGGYAGMSFHASFMPKEEVAVIAFFNDQRGYVLPHLAANLAYNLILAPELALVRFNEELQAFDRSFSREQEDALDASKMVNYSEKWNARLGNYLNTDGWPDITLFNKNNKVWLRHGVLNGPLYTIKGSDSNFVVDLGALRRPIQISATSSDNFELQNGSLVFSQAR